MFSFSSRDALYCKKTSVVAQSAGAQSIDPNSYHNFPLHETTESNWTMSVVGDDGFEAPWLNVAIVTSVLLSMLLSSMLMCILIEKRQHRNLLHEMLPAQALKKLETGSVYVKEYSMVTICFSDIVGYTTLSADMRPIQVMKLLNSFYTEVDKLAVKNKVYKIKTIGDAYMCVGGCPDKCSAVEGAERAAMFALELIDLVKHFRTDDGLQITVRAGLHSGAVVAGVIEEKRPQYTIFGDAVTVASLMEQSSDVMRIQCSAKTSSLLAQAPQYHFSIVEKGLAECASDHDTTRRFRSFYIEGATEINR
jgi:class 3 adenylate cyclase